MRAQVIGLGEFWSHYTYRTMLVGTVMVGLVAGATGCLLHLRRQSLMGDVVGHSSVLGVGLAFLVASTVLDVDGRTIAVLAPGALLTSVVAVVISNWIAARCRIGVDAAMVVSLSLFYGSGIALLTRLTRSRLPNRGGIEQYMFGNAATMVRADLVTVAVLAGLVGIVLIAVRKEMTVHLFDPVLARAQGFAGPVMNTILFLAVAVSVVAGIKAVGTILMVSFAVGPAVAARQWARSVHEMMVMASGLGGLAAALGCWVAVNLGQVPTGPVIVLVLAAMVAVSSAAAALVPRMAGPGAAEPRQGVVRR